MEPASIRTRNPGAMWPGPIATKWGSKAFISLNDGTGQGNKIAIFDTYIAGICAQLDLWRTSPKYRNKRFADAIAIWSGGNHVESYIAFVTSRVPGMTRNTVMDDGFWKSPLGLGFLKAQAGHEAGKTYPAAPSDWAQAQSIVFGKQPKPPATAATKTATTATVTNTTTLTTAAAAHNSGAPWWVVLLVIALGVGITVLAAWFFNREGGGRANVPEAEGA